MWLNVAKGKGKVWSLRMKVLRNSVQLSQQEWRRSGGGGKGSGGEWRKEDEGEGVMICIFPSIPFYLFFPSS